MNAKNKPANDIARQFEHSRTGIGPRLLYALAVLGLPAALPVALASDHAPPAHVASPDVYRVLDENDQFRVIEATWQPGQEDNFHSHPADRVSLYRTDCTLRLTNFDGSTRVGKPKAGTARARTGQPVKSHKAKNIGDQVCVIQIVELK